MTLSKIIPKSISWLCIYRFDHTVSNQNRCQKIKYRYTVCIFLPGKREIWTLRKLFIRGGWLTPSGCTIGLCLSGCVDATAVAATCFATKTRSFRLRQNEKTDKRSGTSWNTEEIWKIPIAQSSWSILFERLSEIL